MPPDALIAQGIEHQPPNSLRPTAVLDRVLPGRAGRAPVRAASSLVLDSLVLDRDRRRGDSAGFEAADETTQMHREALESTTQKTANGGHKPPFRPAVTGQPRIGAEPNANAVATLCSIVTNLSRQSFRRRLTRPSSGTAFASSGVGARDRGRRRVGSWIVQIGASGPDNSVTAIEVITVTGPGRRRPPRQDQGLLSARLTEALSSSASCTPGDVIAAFNARLAPAL